MRGQDLVRTLAPMVAAAVTAFWPALAVTAPLDTYDGVHTGPRGTQTTYFRYDPTLAFSAADLTATGTAAVITTEVAANPQAANWTTGANLYSVGFLRVIPGEPVDAGTPLASPAHDGDPIVWAQDNQGAGPGGTAVCTNDQFFVNGVFVFGVGQQCALPLDNAGQTAIDTTSTLRYSVTLEPGGTYTATVTPLDVDGDVVTAGGLVPFTFSGPLPGDTSTQFVPFIRIRPGIDTGNGLPDPDTPWQYTISGTDLVAPRAAPGASVSDIVCSSGGAGSVQLTTSNTGTAGVYLTTVIDGTAAPATLVAAGTTETRAVPVAAGASVQIAVTWAGGTLVDEVRTSQACTTTTTTTTTAAPGATTTTAPPVQGPTTTTGLTGTLPATGPAASPALLVAAMVCLLAGTVALLVARRSS